MKELFKIFVIVSLVIGFSACEKNTSTEDISTITYYVTFELEGEELMSIELGDPYVEPGYTALEGEEDVTSEVVVSGEVNSESPGLYTLTYSAVNSDGYSSSTDRTVIVYNPAAPDDDFSGTYSSAIERTESDGSNPRNHNATINITKVAQGIFYVDCLLGAIYSISSPYGYGPNYAMTGYIALEADYSLTLLSSYIRGWGDGLEGFQNGVYNTITGIPYWESIYAGGDVYAITLSTD